MHYTSLPSSLPRPHHHPFSSRATFNSSNTIYLYPHTHKQASRRRRPISLYLLDFVRITPASHHFTTSRCCCCARINTTTTYHHHHPQRLSYVSSSPARLRAAAVAGLVSLPSPPLLLPFDGSRKAGGVRTDGFPYCKTFGRKIMRRRGREYGGSGCFMTYYY